MNETILVCLFICWIQYVQVQHSMLEPQERVESRKSEGEGEWARDKLITRAPLSISTLRCYQQLAKCGPAFGSIETESLLSKYYTLHFFNFSQTKVVMSIVNGSKNSNTPQWGNTVQQILILYRGGALPNVRLPLYFKLNKKRLCYLGKPKTYLYLY